MSTTESPNLSQEEGQPQHATTATALDVSEEDAGDTEHRLAVENKKGIVLDEGITFQDNDTGYGAIWRFANRRRKAMTAIEDTSRGQSKGATYDGIGTTQDANPLSTCKFFNLPPEVRQIIYEHALVGYQPKGFADLKLLVWAENITYSQHYQLALMQTCRQIYNEATPLVYRSALFNFACEEYELQHDAATEFLDTIGATNAQYITKIVVKFPDFSGNFDVVGEISNPSEPVEFADVRGWDCVRLMLKSLPNLTTIYFTFCYNIDEYLTSLSLDTEVLENALTCVDKELRKHSTLSKIHICWFNWCDYRQLAEKMLSFGWTVEDEYHLITEENLDEVEIYDPRIRGYVTRRDE